MSSPIVQFTKAGLAELIDAKRLGIKGIITHVSAGDKGYIPSPDQQSLQHEIQRVEVASFEDLSTTQIRLGAKFTGDAEYEVREVGFWLESGTLLAVFSLPDQMLTYKSANSSWIQKFTLDISALPTDSITVEVGVDNLNLMLTEELLIMTRASVINNTATIKTAHMQMQLSERLRLSGV